MAKPKGWCRGPVFAALRTSEDGTERAVIVFNFSRGACRCASPWARGSRRCENYLSGEVIRAENGTLTVDLGRLRFKLFAVTG